MVKITPRIEQAIYDITKLDLKTRQVYIYFGDDKYEYLGLSTTGDSIWARDPDGFNIDLYIGRTTEEGTEYWCLQAPQTYLLDRLLCTVDPE